MRTILSTPLKINTIFLRQSVLKRKKPMQIRQENKNDLEPV